MSEPDPAKLDSSTSESTSEMPAVENATPEIDQADSEAYVTSVAIPPVVAAPPSSNIVVESVAQSATNPSELIPGQATQAVEADVPSAGVLSKSWVFQCFEFFGRASRWCFGVASLIAGLSMLSGIPLLQLLSFGYLLEVCGRINREKKFSAGLIGVSKAARVGGVVFGSWLSLLPVRYVSFLWYSSYLVDPSSRATSGLKVLQIVVTVAMVSHVVAACICGGRLRYFFWPLIAPFSFGLWTVRRLAGSSLFRPVLDFSLGLISPRLVNDLCAAKPLTDWFLPLILLKRIFRPKLFSSGRDAVWEFASSLRLPYYFQLGLKGFVGGLVWLALPTLLLIGAADTSNPGIAFLGVFSGLIFLTAVVAYLPFLQVNFATSGRFAAMFKVAEVRAVFRRAPLMFFLSLLVTLAFAIPLFLLKVERIPAELLWLPGVVFMVFMLPARFFLGWSYSWGSRREKNRHWIFTWSVRMLQIPLALFFGIIVYFTSFTSWNGAWSLLEQHAFLVPAPFFQWPF